MDDLRYWYCFSYNGVSLDCGRQCNASAYTGYKDKGVTLPMTRENKEYAGVDKKAVLISVSYLGHMTKEEFEGDLEDAQ